MKGEAQGPMSRGRPQAAAERSEDRVRTAAKPEALDSGPCELCVDQEVASNADVSRHTSQKPRPARLHRAAQRPPGRMAPLPAPRHEGIRRCHGLPRQARPDQGHRAQRATMGQARTPPPAVRPAAGPSGLDPPGHARLFGIDAQALRGPEVQVLFDGAIHQAPYLGQRRQADAAPFRKTQAQVTEPDLCEVSGYVLLRVVPQREAALMARHNYDDLTSASIASSRSETPVKIPFRIEGAEPASRISSLCTGSTRK